jgi:hypothetical protein
LFIFGQLPKTEKNIKVAGEDVVFIFDNKNKNLIHIGITENDELKAKASGAYQKTNDQEIWSQLRKPGLTITEKELKNNM